MNTYTDYDSLRKSSIEREIQLKVNENGHKNTKNRIMLWKSVAENVGTQRLFD